MALGMKFFNKVEHEKQIKHLKNLDNRIEKATKLHCIPISLEDILTGNEGNIIQMISNKEIIQRFGKIAHPMIKQINLGYIEEDCLVFCIINPLTSGELLPSRGVLLPNGKSLTKHPIPKEKRLHIYETYLASSLLLSARYRGEILGVENIVIGIGEPDTTNETGERHYTHLHTVTQKTWEQAKSQQKGIKDFFAKHSNPYKFPSHLTNSNSNI